MTPADLIFLICAGIAVQWAGYWMREWERRDLGRRLQEATVGWRMELEASIYANHRRIKVESWIPPKFCGSEYLINEVVNRAFIDALWPKRPNPESDPTDCIKTAKQKGMR